MPSSSKNLLFVKQFCSDNDASVHFDSQSVKVVDKVTKETLMVGSIDRGLYRLLINMKGSDGAKICNRGIWGTAIHPLNSLGLVF